MPAINEVFTGTVRGLTSEGDGVVEHASGQVFFVPGVWPGETGTYRVTGFRKRTGFAELVTLVEASPHRVDPPCQHHGFSKRHCGGCPWQFVSVAAQLEEKEQRVRRVMGQLGCGDQVREIWASPQSLGYRNRAQFKSDGRRLGYVSARSNELVGIENCPILTDSNRETLKQLLATLPNKAFRPQRKQQWVTLDIDEATGADSVAVNRRLPFRQGNDEQNQRMRQWLADRLQGVAREAPVLELFAGTGNFTEIIAAAGFPAVHGVEGVVEAVQALVSRGLAAVDAEVGNLFDDNYVRQLATRQGQTGTLVLDPPRDGFRALGMLLASCEGIRDVLYISCNLATFARDVGEVLAQGWQVVEIQPLDLFPHTPHVEILAHIKVGK